MLAALEELLIMQVEREEILLLDQKELLVVVDMVDLKMVLH